MTDTTIAQSKPVLVAIDISKARHEVLIAVPGKAGRRRLIVLNQLDHLNRLVATVAEHGHPVRVAFEATGNSHRALAYHLGCADFDVKLVSSVALARTRRRSQGRAGDPAHDDGREIGSLPSSNAIRRRTSSRQWTRRLSLPMLGR